jgi:2-C-methyl-D-erythritol 4-phosphate cytidylyltransferase
MVQAYSLSDLRMNTAVIVAAGRGTRMGPGVDKLFLEVAGAPVVAHTWRRFDACPAVDEVVLVVREGMEGPFQELAEEWVRPLKPWRCVVGGRERQDSVWNGLEGLPDGHWVAIQDGARPCTTEETITRCLEAALKSGASVAAQRSTDTMKEADGEGCIARHLDRSSLWSVQTPQCFRVGVLRAALSEVRRLGKMVTDDTAACGLIGQSVTLVECRDPNPKVTSPSDLAYVGMLLGGVGGKG